MTMVRRREGRRDAAALIDATIVAVGVGVGVVAYAFVIVGAAADPDVSTVGRVVSIAYPACDVLVAGVIVRLLVRSGAASVPAMLLVTAISVLLLGDMGFAVAVFTGRLETYPAWIDAGYLAYYLLVGLTMARSDARAPC